ncbi:putative manganese transporter [Thalassotalea sp. 1_MG-2023]|uniref:putative manganese transporter n=1 Tax=Thalassotalea sp. 1_MG-2023 TaxID=3062680 RepID=UPI0026E13573|nr:putative manganese transporter [Thalassotalea sp. 1_MG-2023]MDO6427874.1 putative manganese transporter [Thalassotalea sp. 1_MG-2023]
MATSLYQKALLWRNTKDFPQYRRLFLPSFLIALLIIPATQSLTLNVLSDAFWQVAVFVAMSLSLYHLVVNSVSKTSSYEYFVSTFISTPNRQIILAAFLGLLPGCGGAIIVISQYVSGSMRFGAVVAVLTATMGDAAFLLLAAQPKVGIAIIAACFIVGVLSGIMVNMIHGDDFLRPILTNTRYQKGCKTSTNKPLKRVMLQGRLWQLLLIPCAIIAVLMAAQIELPWFSSQQNRFIHSGGAMLAFLFILLWATTRETKSFKSIVAEDDKPKQHAIFQRVALDTNFIISWVVIALLCFELIVFFTDLQLTHLFSALPAITPLISVLVGMIPGCGPQILTTTLYLNGAIPLSAQLGNAISNDGDALFPAIALSPKVAVIATCYSAIPALLAAYGYFLLFEY